MSDALPIQARPVTGGYQVFGLHIHSELPLVELPSADGPGPDVEIRFGAIDSRTATSPGYSVAAGETLLTVPKVGRYRITGGREIVVDPLPSASERNVRLFLLGSALGALLHQRGMLPLHANAIDLRGRAVAFSGHSGAGKSTIAAWFHDRGRPILSDDVCVIGFDEAGRAIAHPGIPRLRLWREALEASGRTAGQFQRSFDDTDKYDVPTDLSHVGQPLPLDRIYLLRKTAEDGADARIRRLTGVEAVDALVANTYRGGFVRTIGRTGEHLAACLRIARSIPVFEAARKWGFDSFEEQAGLLEAHALEAIA
jgi:hypothetical protein